ncbi:MAG TPA: hypothetical protein VNB06_15995 [Thermoanaerobaculia bacterium]|nr:hypothetical protein [Thermoanaerobaculia bacterium]
MSSRSRHTPSQLPYRALAGVAVLVGLAIPALAQLPADAVDLGLVKVPETLEAIDLDPVTLEPSAAGGETWTHDGVTYRSGKPGSKEAFSADPEKYAAAAAKERWIQNFMLAMSTIWCPITDEVTPGGRKQVEGLGYNWESCCSFCDDEMREENFPDALTRLRERAEEAFELTAGEYVEGASSPVEGAIREG